MTVLEAPAATAADVRRLPRRTAFLLQASIVVVLLAGSSAPTPLYAVYQQAWGFSPITVTVVFGVYAVAVLLALLTAGALSDHVGRRPILLVALPVQAVTMIAFATASGVPELLGARVAQGLSTGAALGALGAGMLDLSKRGTLANAVAPMTGTAVGALGSAVFVAFLPAPTHLVYLVLAAVFAVQFVGVLLMPETADRRAGALRSLRPRLATPTGGRIALVAAVPALVAVWALAGFYGSLGPALVRLVVGSDSLLFGGLALFVMAGAGALAVVLTRDLPARTVLAAGAVALIVGVGLTLVTLERHLPLVFFVGAAVAGAGFGGAFQGALRTVIPLATPHERAGVLSTLYVVSYLAMGLPAVAAGYLVSQGNTVLTAAREYGLGVILLGAIALLGVLVSRPQRAAAEWAG